MSAGSKREAVPGRVTDLGDLLLAARGRLELHVVGLAAEAFASLHLRLVQGLRELEFEVLPGGVTRVDLTMIPRR